jgi:hypothetical protein
VALRRKSEPAAERPKRSLSALVAQAAAVVGLVGGVLSLVFLVRPGCKPEPPTPPSAEISDVRVERPVTFRSYLARLRRPAGSLSEEFLARPGVLAEFRYVAEGLKGTELPLRWELIDESTGDQVGEDSRVSIQPRSDPERRTWFVWSELPRTGRSYHLVISLYRGDELAPLARVATGSFAGLPP